MGFLKGSSGDVRFYLFRDKRRYKNICTAVINEAFRKLEQFLVEDCQRNIKPLTSQEMRALFAILTNSQNKFEED